MRSRHIARAALAAMIAAASAGCDRDAAPRFRMETAGAQTPAVTSAQASAATDSSRRTALVAAIERVSSSVVSINVARRQHAARSPWDLFFVPQTERVVQGYGTGLILRSNGIILTNQHVVGGAERVIVTLPDGTDLPATVLGEDPVTDVAVLRVERRDLRAITIGRSTDLMIGEWVVAFGNPYAYLLGNAEPTVTVGVVSASGRHILPNGEQAGLYLDMIQTDAAINPGNSGGPLSNALGQVIGVNSSIFSNTGGSIGLGFAIPIERAVRVADQIIRNGSVRRAWVGLEIEGVGAIRGGKSTNGVLVTSMAPDGPAARAGIRVGDALTEANGRPLRNYLDWEAVKLDLHAGDAVELAARRGTRVLQQRVVTGDLPTITAAKVTVLRDLQLVTVTPAIRAERGLASGHGALIYQLSSAVSRATGLQPADVIVQIDRTRIRTAAQVSELLDVRPGQVVRIYFERNRQLSSTDLVFQ